MFSNQSADYNLNSPARAIDGIPKQNAWWLGTCAFQQANSVQRIEYHAETNELHCRQTYTLSDEDPIRCIQSLEDGEHVVVATEQGSSATIYRLPCSDDGGAPSHHDSQEAQEITRLTADDSFGANLIDLAFYRSSQDLNDAADQAVSSNVDKSLLTLDSTGKLACWDLQAPESPVRSLDIPSASVAYWDPHSSGSHAVVAARRTVHMLDWRQDTSIPTGLAERTPISSTICDVDFNPNQPHTLAIASHDAKARIYDLRNASRPLLTISSGHSYWMTNLQYNYCHDPLLATGSSDATTLIWRIASITPLGLPNRRITKHAGYNLVQWSRNDPWIYVTLSSSDGAMALHHVPSKEKYKILL